MPSIVTYSTAVGSTRAGGHLLRPNLRNLPPWKLRVFQSELFRNAVGRFPDHLKEPDDGEQTHTISFQLGPCPLADVDDCLARRLEHVDEASEVVRLHKGALLCRARAGGRID